MVLVIMVMIWLHLCALSANPTEIYTPIGAVLELLSCTNLTSVHMRSVIPKESCEVLFTFISIEVALLTHDAGFLTLMLCSGLFDPERIFFLLKMLVNVIALD